MEKMQVRFERCKGCGLCVTVCPKQIVALQKEHRNEKGYFTAECTDQDACISCAMCAMICPDCASMMMADVDVICGNPVVAFASDAVAVLVCAASHGIHMLRNSTHTII